MSIIKVTGRLEVIGPSDSSGTINSEESGQELYSYLRIDGPDGKAKLLEHVVARRQIAAFLQPGVTGDFYMVELRGKSVSRLLFAFTNGKTHATDVEITEYLIKFMKRQERWKLLQSVSAIVVGLGLLLLIVGWPFLLFGIFNLYSVYRSRVARLMVPNSDQLVSALREAGVPTG